LLDEAGLLTAMAYVDLNPIRAGIAVTPEESDFTSIHARILALKAKKPEVRVALLDFQSKQATSSEGIPFGFHAYLELVDWTGRRIVEGKRGAIEANVPPILQRLNMDVASWERVMRPRGNVFGRAVGRVERLRMHAQCLGQAWIRGLAWARRLYRTS
jgi:hypothetical protein